MSHTPDPLDMLDVIEESRQRAMAQREAALDHMATIALQAVVEGQDVREVAKRCGFSPVAKEVQPSPEASEMRGLLNMSTYLWGSQQVEETPDQRFADWLAKAIKKLVMEGLEK